MVFRKGMMILGVAAACVGGMAAGISASAEDRIIQGVFIDDLDVSGMTYDEAKKAVEQKVSQMQKSSVTVQVGEDTIEATMVDLGLQWKNREVVDQAVSIGNSGNLIKRYKEEKDLEKGPVSLELEFYGNKKVIKDFIEEDCSQFEREAQQASIESDGAGGVNMQPGVTGQHIDVDESVKAVRQYIAKEWNGEDNATVALSVELDEPAADGKDLEQITDMLGTYTTYYGSTYGRNTNVERGAELINGHLLMPGDSFSVCDNLVPFSAENGYELGGAYENGRVVQEYGGGICQVSTTLYNALLLAEIQIDERHNHTMSVSYVPTSMDAAIAEGSMDLVFTNNMDTPIFISGYAYGGELTFTVWGKETRPADRYVEYYSETTSTLAAPTTVQLVPAENQTVGYFSQVQASMAGSTAVLYKYVTYNGETTVEQVNSSTYEATPATYEVGTIGATDTLWNAIYNNDLATAQLAATGVISIGTTDTTGTTGETQQQETTAPQTEQQDQTQNQTEASGSQGGTYIDTIDGEVWVPNTDGSYTDPNYGVTEPDYSYTDPSYELTDGVVVWE